MYRPKPMSLDDPLSARSGLRGLVCALVCSLACGCGGGGSSSGTTQPSPPPPPPPTPTTDSLLAVTNATAGSIDLLTIDTTTGVPSPVASNPMPDGPTPAAIAI